MPRDIPGLLIEHSRGRRLPASIKWDGAAPNGAHQLLASLSSPPLRPRTTTVPLSTSLQRSDSQPDWLRSAASAAPDGCPPTTPFPSAATYFQTDMQASAARESEHATSFTAWLQSVCGCPLAAERAQSVAAQARSLAQEQCLTALLMNGGAFSGPGTCHAMGPLRRPALAAPPRRPVLSRLRRPGVRRVALAARAATAGARVSVLLV